MLSSGNNLDYTSNYIIIKRICEKFDLKFEAYVRNHYIKLLKTTQKLDGGSDKFPLAQSLAFYLKQDRDMLMQNVEMPDPLSLGEELFKTMSQKLGFSKSKTQQQDSEECNWLKFQIKMVTNFRRRNVGIELERCKYIEDVEALEPRMVKIQKQHTKLKQELKISKSALENVKIKKQETSNPNVHREKQLLQYFLASETQKL